MYLLSVGLISQARGYFEYFSVNLVKGYVIGSFFNLNGAPSKKLELNILMFSIKIPNVYFKQNAKNKKKKKKKNQF